MGINSKAVTELPPVTQGDLFTSFELPKKDEGLLSLQLPDPQMYAAAVQAVTSLGGFLITDYTRRECMVHISSPQTTNTLVPPQRTIVFSAKADRTELGFALAHGMGAYIAFSGMSGKWDARLQRAVTLVAAGHSALQKLVACAGVGLDECPLSDSDIEILQYIADDMTDASVADQMNLQEQTIKNRLHAIYRKLGSKYRRAGAVAHALRTGWID